MYTCIDTTTFYCRGTIPPLFTVPLPKATSNGGIDTRIHDFPGLVEALAIKSGGIDTRIHDFHVYWLGRGTSNKKWWYRYTYT